MRGVVKNIKVIDCRTHTHTHGAYDNKTYKVTIDTITIIRVGSFSC